MCIMYSPTKYYRCTCSGMYKQHVLLDDKRVTLDDKIFISSYLFKYNDVIEMAIIKYPFYYDFKLHIVDEITYEDFNNKEMGSLPIKQFIFDLWN